MRRWNDVEHMPVDILTPGLVPGTYDHESIDDATDAEIIEFLRMALSRYGEVRLIVRDEPGFVPVDGIKILREDQG